ncbi:hypothetical protein [Sphingobium lactosutens]|uniref:hypothetical protein n=1 Tax=Sphingobium lactosutens TaxID=522773 RepID=UPI0015BB5924|nr:hypothetical protein [Sphingobium lactosutens]
MHDWVEQNIVGRSLHKWIVAALLTASMAMWIGWKVIAPGESTDKEPITIADAPGDLPNASAGPENAGGSSNPLPSSLSAPAALRQHLASEPRDPSWSPQAERALDAYFNDSDNRSAVRTAVYCSNAHCVAAGTIAGSNQPAALRNSMQTIQDKATNATKAWLGFAPGATVSFSAAPSTPGILLFTAYVARKEERPAGQ